MTEMGGQYHRNIHPAHRFREVGGMAEPAFESVCSQCSGLVWQEKRAFFDDENAASCKRLRIS
jgi:hypothetical protein